MLYQPQQHRHSLIRLARRVLSWRPRRPRMDVRELSGHLRDDIGVPDYSVGRCRTDSLV